MRGQKSRVEWVEHKHDINHDSWPLTLVFQAPASSWRAGTWREQRRRGRRFWKTQEMRIWSSGNWICLTPSPSERLLKSSTKVGDQHFNILTHCTQKWSLPYLSFVWDVPFRGETSEYPDKQCRHNDVSLLQDCWRLRNAVRSQSSGWVALDVLSVCLHL